jgi:hypothetical protein
MTHDHISPAFSVKVMHAVFAIRRGRWGSDGKGKGEERSGVIKREDTRRERYIIYIHIYIYRERMRERGRGRGRGERDRETE